MMITTKTKTFEKHSYYIYQEVFSIIPNILRIQSKSTITWPHTICPCPTKFSMVYPREEIFEISFQPFSCPLKSLSTSCMFQRFLDKVNRPMIPWEYEATVLTIYPLSANIHYIRPADGSLAAFHRLPVKQVRLDR